MPVKPPPISTAMVWTPAVTNHLFPDLLHNFISETDMFFTSLTDLGTCSEHLLVLALTTFSGTLLDDKKSDSLGH